MMKNDYRSLIILLFGSDNFIKDITEALAFYYSITTQECMLNVSNNLKNLLQLKNRNKMNVLRH